MAKTRQDLVYRALYNLGVLPHGQNPGDQEYNSVDALVDSMTEDLIHLAAILAGHSASVFGMQNDQALVARAQKGEKDLEIISATRPTYETLEVQAY
jgi:hypothetical protein